MQPHLSRSYLLFVSFKGSYTFCIMFGYFICCTFHLILHLNKNRRDEKARTEAPDPYPTAASQKTMIFMFIISSCLTVAFSKLDLDDNRVEFCDSFSGNRTHDLDIATMF